MLPMIALALVDVAAANGNATPRPVEVVLCRHVQGRRAVEPVTEVAAGTTVYAWIEAQPDERGFVEQVWRRDGIEVARHYLPISTKHRYRTWSKHKLRPGAYTVEVISADGKVLARQGIEALLPEEIPGC